MRLVGFEERGQGAIASEVALLDTVSTGGGDSVSEVMFCYLYAVG